MKQATLYKGIRIIHINAEILEVQHKIWNTSVKQIQWGLSESDCKNLKLIPGQILQFFKRGFHPIFLFNGVEKRDSNSKRNSFSKQNKMFRVSTG